METTTTFAPTVTRAQLSPILDAAITNLPGIGERAVKAAELIVTGQVSRLPDQSGADAWIVGSQTGQRSYAVSIRGRSCDCQDAAHGAPRHNGGPLCKHRLAAMFMFRLVGDIAPTPGDQIRAILDHATATGAETVTLFVGKDYSTQDAGTVGSYRVGKSAQVDTKIQIDGYLGSFWAAVGEAGWCKSNLGGRKGYTEVWVMVPDSVPAPGYPQAEAILDPARFTEDDDGLLWA